MRSYSINIKLSNLVLQTIKETITLSRIEEEGFKISKNSSSFIKIPQAE